MAIFCNSLRSRPSSKELISREVGFDNSTCISTYPVYSPFYDEHMREYWLSPVTRKRLVDSGFLTKDEKQLIDPDKEKKRILTVQKRIHEAEKRFALKQDKVKMKLFLQNIWFQRQLVRLKKRDSIDACRPRTR
jgi:hypothetical protein